MVEINQSDQNSWYDLILKGQQNVINVASYEAFLQNAPNGIIDLILTDPPYAISRKTGFKNVGPRGVQRLAVSMDFGAWDAKPIDTNQYCQLAFDALRNGGTAIIFYDVWKLTTLTDSMVTAGFKQIRLIEWIKSNPVPLNSKVNYLSNCREIAVLGVKKGKPTFNSQYDNGIYLLPILNKINRLHPTQKPLKLIRDLVKKHSNKGDLIVDTFLGSGTTAVAAKLEGRKFAGCDLSEEYVTLAKNRLQNESGIR